MLTGRGYMDINRISGYISGKLVFFLMQVRFQDSDFGSGSAQMSDQLYVRSGYVTPLFVPTNILWIADILSPGRLYKCIRIYIPLAIKWRFHLSLPVTSRVISLEFLHNFFLMSRFAGLALEMRVKSGWLDTVRLLIEIETHFASLPYWCRGQLARLQHVAE